MPWALLLPCSLQDRAVGEQGSGGDQGCGGKMGALPCPALPLSSWDKRVPVRILLGSSTDPTVGAGAATATSATGRFCFPKYSHNDPVGGPRSGSYRGRTAGCVPCSHPRPHHPQGLKLSMSHPMSRSPRAGVPTQTLPLPPMHPSPPAQQLCRNHHFIAAVAGSVLGTFSKAC